MTLALSNLVANAITYSPDHSKVVVSVLPSELMVDLTVTDEGIGIPAAELDRIFERFYRVETSRTRDAGGAGLGLSIVSALVSAHGGSVSVVETAGAGATFRVVLPLAPAHSDLPGVAQAEFSDSAESGSHG